MRTQLMRLSMSMINALVFITKFQTKSYELRENEDLEFLKPIYICENC